MMSLTVKYISENTNINSIAWILMGKHASEFDYLTNKNNHKSFISSHPSPFSAHKPFRNYPSFIGSGIFKKVNQFLILNRKEEIKW